MHISNEGKVEQAQTVVHPPRDEKSDFESSIPAIGSSVTG